MLTPLDLIFFVLEADMEKGIIDSSCDDVTVMTDTYERTMICSNVLNSPVVTAQAPSPWLLGEAAPP